MFYGKKRIEVDVSGLKIVIRELKISKLVLCDFELKIKNFVRILVHNSRNNAHVHI